MGSHRQGDYGSQYADPLHRRGSGGRRLCDLVVAVKREVANGHTPYRCNDALPDCREVWCEKHHGELFYCTTCHGGEGNLPTECPGYPMTEDQRQRVMAEWIDFRGGKWVALGKRDHSGRVYRERYDGERIYK